MQAVRCGDWQDLGKLRQPHLSLHVTTTLSARNKAAFYPSSEAGLICATNAGFKTSRNELRQQSDTPPRLIQSQFWAPSPLLVQVLSSCLKTKTMYTNTSSRVFFFFFSPTMNVWLQCWECWQRALTGAGEWF